MSSALQLPDENHVPLPENKSLTIRDRLETPAFREQMKMLIPNDKELVHFCRTAMNALLKTPRLAECNQPSFFNAMFQCAQMGLAPDGRRVHLIPFMNGKTGEYEVQLIIDYKGMIELIMRTGNVSYIHADLVREADDFFYDKGHILKHVIDFRKPRGPAFCVYALCKFKDGTEKTEVMSMDEVEGIRRRSKAANAGPWVTDFGEMSKKTAFRRLSKWLVFDTQTKDAIDKDDAIDIDSERIPATPSVPNQFMPTPAQNQITAGGLENPTPEAPAKRKYVRQAPKAPEAPKAPPAQDDGFTIPPDMDTGSTTDPFEEPPKVESAAVETPQQKLERLVYAAGFTWSDMLLWHAEIGFCQQDLAGLSGFKDLNTREASRLNSSMTGLISGLTTTKANAAKAKAAKV